MLAVHGFAAAHTDLLRTQPEAGSEVEELDAIELFFTTPLTDTEVRVLHTSESLPVTTVIDETGTQVTTTLDSEPEEGLYQVVWSATAADDGHTISGSFNFEYNAPPTPSEMRAGIVLIVVSLVTFIGLLIWQRRVAARRAS